MGFLKTLAVVIVISLGFVILHSRNQEQNGGCGSDGLKCIFEGEECSRSDESTGPGSGIIGAEISVAEASSLNTKDVRVPNPEVCVAGAEASSPNTKDVRVPIPEVCVTGAEASSPNTKDVHVPIPEVCVAEALSPNTKDVHVPIPEVCVAGAEASSPNTKDVHVPIPEVCVAGAEASSPNTTNLHVPIAALEVPETVPIPFNDWISFDDWFIVPSNDESRIKSLPGV